MTSWRSGGSGADGRRNLDDTGGAWIVTAVVLGVLAYLGVVVMAVAGFTAVVPLVVLPPVLVALIGGNNLLGGGRSHGRSPGRPVGRGQAPLSSSGPDGPDSPLAVPRPRRPADGQAGEQR
ncbi:MAG TPA: hypothetical protein VMV06_06630 [Acidimicrobiales bacterium]|nr:hypothetical protein [Acidimicrobiales bacterium]